jgi:hypothetical protein
MNLQDVDVRAQSLYAGIYRIEDVLAGQTDTVDQVTVVASRRRNRREIALVVHAEEALGEDDHAIARDVVLFQGLADDLL